MKRELKTSLEVKAAISKLFPFLDCMCLTYTFGILDDMLSVDVSLLIFWFSCSGQERLLNVIGSKLLRTVIVFIARGSVWV